MTSNRQWHVLLIGGPSGVGKSSLALELGQRYATNVTQLDDLQAALESVTTPAQLPLLHYWRTNWSDFSAFTDEEHVSHFLDVSRQVFTPLITAVIADRLDGGMPAIIEGGFVLPELAAQPDYKGQSNEGRVHALFVDETEEAQIAANVVAREGRGGPFDAALPARTSWLKGIWLREECRRLNLPYVAARPWDSLADRAVTALAPSEGEE
jgi:2-phosphoglycerate kinase